MLQKNFIRAGLTTYSVTVLEHSFLSCKTTPLAITMLLPILSETIRQIVPFATLLVRKRFLTKLPYIYFSAVESVKIL
jgi:hypothetical protein